MTFFYEEEKVIIAKIFQAILEQKEVQNYIYYF